MKFIGRKIWTELQQSKEEQQTAISQMQCIWFYLQLAYARQIDHFQFSDD